MVCSCDNNDRGRSFCPKFWSQVADLRQLQLHCGEPSRTKRDQVDFKLLGRTVSQIRNKCVSCSVSPSRVSLWPAGTFLNALQQVPSPEYCAYVHAEG